ncbi:hypothetical protein P8452_38177 [Trifolium repens]|nr:hypothetical protein P8452_38177 [Trifolium repens]
MASSSSSRNMVPFAVDDKEPVIIDNSGFVSEPAMTSVESSVWGEELIIPHKLEEEITAQYWGQASKKEFNGDERDWRAHQAEETRGSYY